MKRCLVCHRELMDPRSIELGIGPVCRKKVSLEILEELKAEGLSGILIKDGIQLQVQLEEGGAAG